MNFPLVRLLRPWRRVFTWIAAGCLLMAGLVLLASHLLAPALPDVALRPETTSAAAERVEAFFGDIPEAADLPPSPVVMTPSPMQATAESPLLRKLAEAGELPPVSERVGSDPLVLAALDSPAYGGTLVNLGGSAGDLFARADFLMRPTLVRWSPGGYPIEPWVARAWSMSADARTWTFHLRRGVRWSDGAPLTASDYAYAWENNILFAEGDADRFADWMRARGEIARFEEVDAYTFRLHYPHPKPQLLEALTMATKTGFDPFPAPRHYLEPYHWQRGDPEKIERIMEATSALEPRSAYSSLFRIDNPQLPGLGPWVYQRFKSNPPHAYVRNPYYFGIDSEGRQLPYLDQLLFDVRSPKLLPVSIAAGEATFHYRDIRVDELSLLLSQQENNNFTVLKWLPAHRSDWAIWPNLNRFVPPGDKAAAQKKALLDKVMFRRALSLAIDRERIIHARYFGIGEPAQIAPPPNSPLASEELARSYVAHDPERADRMLDELGLTQRDDDGYRTLPDGSRMAWYLYYTTDNGMGPAPFIVEDWARVGIRLVLKERSRALFFREKFARVQDFVAYPGETEAFPLVQPRSFVPTSQGAHYALGYAYWFQQGGLWGAAAARSGRAVEPPMDHPLRRALELYGQIVELTDQTERQRLMREILAIAAENVWSINISTPLPYPVVVDNRLQGVPETAYYSYFFRSPYNAFPERFYLREQRQTAAMEAEITAQLRQPNENPLITGGSAQTGETSWVGRFVPVALAAILILLLALAASRHPYIGKRLLIMVPTLFIISLIVFTIIQLPPGSYLETRKMEMLAIGDEGALEYIELLEETFRQDQPLWRQYTWWLGLDWFFSFAPEDRGLLQGNLGTSMQSMRSVNEMVGDRILLTMAVSFGTILFTWLMALPIGIYSAVRQYTFGDYLFTTIGFLGMCIPNFLLAIILIAIGEALFGVTITGLFSPQYALQPEWTWGKFLDLLRHIWVPIVVLGTAGTGGMIRVMRANLLDEMRKPYVTTARAKGVRPIKLILKYPVRLALNPFISGIGGIFPALVSGGAIVAIVLSLPTVGPLLLDAVMNEDLYFAGSLLMVLSLLSVMGTLVSDLLLMVLDPRIRMEGGQK